MDKGRVRPSKALQHFTNREDESALFRQYVETAEGSQLPILVFYGIGGIGKTWLAKRLRLSLEEPPFAAPGQTTIPSARVDFESETGSLYCTDPAAACLRIRLDLGVDCPGFDLVYAMLRYRQGAGVEPHFRHSGALHTAWEFVSEVSGKAAESIPGGSLTLWAARKLTEHLGRRFEETAIGRRLLTAAGNAEFFNLRRQDPDVLYRLLPERLAADLEEHLPLRPTKACRAVVFLDTFEALQAATKSSAQQFERETWIRTLYEQLQSVLLVITGRDRLTWAEHDADWRNPECLDQHLLGGLSAHDATTFLDKCGVTQEPLQSAVLKACLDAAAVPGAMGYHPYSLGLCADTIVNERNRGLKADPASFDIGAGDFNRLAQRFLKSLPNDSQADWLMRLAFTPRFDEQAARYAYSAAPGADQNAAWNGLMGYSFMKPLDPAGWWMLHPRMKAALRQNSAHAEIAGPPDRETFWRDYWQSRAHASTDEFAALSWYHRYRLEPDEARSEWIGLQEQTCAGDSPDMVLHGRLLDWWVPTEIESTARAERATATSLFALGMGLMNSSIGNLTVIVHRAIACYTKALPAFSEQNTPELWADLEGCLGDAYSRLPIEHGGVNLRTALSHFEQAERVQTETDHPEEWASLQTKAGDIYRRLPDGSRQENVQKALACYRAALRIYPEEQCPRDWASIQHLIGRTYCDLPDRDRSQNIQHAIECFGAALRVWNETEFTADWVLNQRGLGNAYLELEAGDQNENVRKAIACFESALRVTDDHNFPLGWARLQDDLGRALTVLPSGDRRLNLQNAIDCFQNASRIDKELNALEDLARTMCNLGTAYAAMRGDDAPATMEKATACFEAALRVFTEENHPFERARTAANLARIRQDQGDAPRAQEAFASAARAYRKLGLEDDARDIDDEMKALRGVAIPVAGNPGVAGSGRRQVHGTDVDRADGVNPLASGGHMNRDQIEGKAEELKGRIKQAAAHVTDDPELHDEGVGDEVAGKTQSAIGHGKEKVGEAVENIGKAIKK